MSEQSVTAKRALHARPASQLATLAAGFEAAASLELDGRAANAKSVLSLMGLDLEAGDEVLVRTSGEDAEQALAAIAEMLSSEEDDDV